MSSFIVSFQIPADPPKRLDKALSRDVPEDADISRSQIVRFLEKGAVRVEGVVQSEVKAKVEEGQLVEIIIPEAVATETLAQNIPLTNWSRGISTLRFFKLCSRAPLTEMDST